MSLSNWWKSFVEDFKKAFAEAEAEVEARKAAGEFSSDPVRKLSASEKYLAELKKDLNAVAVARLQNGMILTSNGKVVSEKAIYVPTWMRDKTRR